MPGILKTTKICNIAETKTLTTNQYILLTYNFVQPLLKLIGEVTKLRYRHVITYDHRCVLKAQCSQTRVGRTKVKSLEGL